MRLRIFEISTKDSKDGRRKVKVVLHEIHSDNSQYNKNGITWLEEYCKPRLETIKGMSITCEFTNEERTEILGHGETGIEDSMPVCENATMVGVLDKGYIEDIKLDGKIRRVCMAEGTLDALRYKNFVDVLEKKYVAGEVVYGSVEIMGLKENDNSIKYLNDFRGTGRVPTEYRYSGFALLGIEPADDTARLVEINNRKDSESMDEIKKSLDELKSRLDKMDEIETKKAELEACKKEIDELKERNVALSEELEKIKAEKEAVETDNGVWRETVDEMRREMDAIKTESLKKKLEESLAEFSEDEKKIAKDEIEAFNKDPLNAPKGVDEIVDKILANIGKEIYALRKKKVSESNSCKVSKIDIFGEVMDDCAKPDNVCIF